MLHKDLMGTREIILTRGLKALVDEEDYEWLNQWKWYVNYGGYAERTTSRKEIGGRKNIRMHRLIMNAKEGQEIDHKNRNKLNNCKNNLRFCTRTQNNGNWYQQNKYGYKGVLRIISTTGNIFWSAYISHNKKKVYCGCYTSIIDAAKAYDKKALELFGEFSCLNFPKFPSDPYPLGVEKCPPTEENNPSQERLDLTYHKNQD